MEKKHFHLLKNMLYWVALIISLMTLVPTNRELIVWYAIGALLCATILFSLVNLGPKYLTKFISENYKSSIPILLFCGIHSATLARSFYLLWIPSNKLAALASRLHLNSTQLLWVIIIVAFPCVVCSLLVFCSFLLSKYQKDNRPITEVAVVAFFALMVFQITQGISCGTVGGIRLKHVFCGTLIVLTLITMVNTICANNKVSVLIGTLPFPLFATVNYYVYCFRGRELCPYDILSFGTAMNVVSEYRFFFSLFVLLGWLAWLLLMVSFFLTKRETKGRKKNTRIYSVGICLVSLLLVFVLEKDTPTKTWALGGSSTNGTVLNFLLQLRDSRIEKPENYSSDTLRQLEEKYHTNNTAKSDRNPSIIVIMNESFTDFSVLGNDIQTEEPLLPFISSMEENTVRGYVYSSVYGGNTANSEFEFLTGDTMAFLPYGSVPYQQYLHEEQYSLVSYFHSMGYNCMATHPYYASGWNRPEVYNYFGFDQMTFIDDYPQTGLIRKYIGDREMYEYIIKQFENRDQSKGFFLFGVTVQNHGGYTYNNYKSTVSLKYSKDYPETEQFLSLANLSDQAVKYLVDYFSQTPEPVVICFFGDHQPKIENAFLETVHGGGFDNLESEMLKYKVPFFIWANYDIEERRDIETSINYLSTYLLETCGLELPAYNKFLRDAEQSIPIITGNGYYSLSNGRFIPISEASGEEEETLNQYQILQYNNLFDKKHLGSIFLPEDVAKAEHQTH